MKNPRTQCGDFPASSVWLNILQTVFCSSSLVKIQPPLWIARAIQQTAEYVLCTCTGKHKMKMSSTHPSFMIKCPCEQKHFLRYNEGWSQKMAIPKKWCYSEFHILIPSELKWPSGGFFQPISTQKFSPASDTTDSNGILQMLNTQGLGSCGLLLDLGDCHGGDGSQPGP